MKLFRQQERSLAKTQRNFLAVFVIANLVIFLGLFFFAFNQLRHASLSRLDAQSAHAQQLLDDKLLNIKVLTSEMLKDRKLAFLVNGSSLLSNYERQDSALTEQERLVWIELAYPQVQHAAIYLPRANSVITDNEIRKMTASDRSFLQKNRQRIDGNLIYQDKQLYMLSSANTAASVDEVPDLVIATTLSMAHIKAELNDANTDVGGGSYVYNDKLNLLLASRNARQHSAQLAAILGSKKTLRSVTVDGVEYQCAITPSAFFGSYVQFTPTATAMQALNRFKWIAVGYVVLMAAVLYWYSQNLRRRVHRPLNQLVDTFRTADAGGRLQLVKYDHDDEFGYLFHEFNKMQRRLNQLIADVAQQQNLAKEAQVKQLQAQINPHFLYNSFFALKRRIQNEDLDGAAELATHLGNYFRFITKNESDQVSLKAEVAHAQSYTAIQQDRFGERITVVFAALPEEMAELEVPRLILQPIIENVFKYGLEQMPQGALLKISFASGQDTCAIRIEDNEAEFAMRDLLRVKQHLLAREQPTGLGNINQRLKLMFGQEYGLDVSVSDLGGPAFTITLPMLDES